MPATPGGGGAFLRARRALPLTPDLETWIDDIVRRLIQMISRRLGELEFNHDRASRRLADASALAALARALDTVERLHRTRERLQRVGGGPEDRRSLSSVSFSAAASITDEQHEQHAETGDSNARHHNLEQKHQ